MRRIVTRIAIAAVVLVAAIIPAAPAAADSWSNCDDYGPFVACIVLEGDQGSLRAFGSLEDQTTGNDVVAVVARLWYYSGPVPDLADTSPPALANDYALTATRWFKCKPGSYLAQLDWNYKGQQTGTIFVPDRPVPAVC